MKKIDNMRLKVVHLCAWLSCLIPVCSCHTATQSPHHHVSALYFVHWNDGKKFEWCILVRVPVHTGGHAIYMSGGIF